MVIAKCQRHFSIQSIKSDAVILSSFLPRWRITITWFIFRPSPFSIVNVLIWQINWNILSHPTNFPHRKKSTFRSPIQSHLTKRPHTASTSAPANSWLTIRMWRNVPTACQGVNWPSWFWPFNRLFLALAPRAWRRWAWLRWHKLRMGMEVYPHWNEQQKQLKIDGWKMTTLLGCHFFEVILLLVSVSLGKKKCSDTSKWGINSSRTTYEQAILSKWSATGSSFNNFCLCLPLICGILVDYYF